ncbi:hypothetical protein SAMN04515674_110159 [Pseudarcicella hirudinis]|uniref:Uncharacterized protein n=1 Tax=Pseudarcicella hirudinis TaxID=1079859 RepID=A0A1I5VZT5_9BACT|nr:hypothetical protein [Pseudarcicella hirudinis]SFQ12981.1 hypothetical protein SAMN04515674_110159 [Pseudarcicella hirudinis]
MDFEDEYLISIDKTNWLLNLRRPLFSDMLLIFGNLFKIIPEIR